MFKSGLRLMGTMANIRIVREAAPVRSGVPASVIMLHGLGDSAEGWQFIADEAHKIPQLRHIDFVLPSAPQRHITAFGEHIPGWFDVIEFRGRAEDAEGVKGTLEFVRGLVKAEIERGVPADRIILGGFSQGGAMTAASVLTLPEKIAGFIIMSAWLPIEAELNKLGTNKLNITTPIFELHGTADQVVPYAWGKKTAEVLKSKYGYENVNFKTYDDAGHTLNMEGIADVFGFLNKYLPAK